MYLAIRCEAVPGKLTELDGWLKTIGAQFWSAQSGVESVELFSDTVGYPERTLMVGLKDFTNPQRILASAEQSQFRNELSTYATDVQSQILERIVLEQETSRGPVGFPQPMVCR